LLLPFYGLANPYFARFARNVSQVSILEQAISLNPTFFTLWIGNNDVLTYALAGGEADSLTSVPTFTLAYSTIINTLTSNGAKGAVANIPDITSIAYFTTFPYNALVLTDQAQVDALNAAYSALGITFSLGANGLIVQDPSAPGGMRQIKSSELVLLSLPQDSIKCKGWGSAIPVPDKYFLSEDEIADIKNATNEYNTIISNIADSKGLAYVDANAMLKSAKSGLVFDGAKYSAAYISGGINSLDGIHLTPRGNALVANYFIQAINAKYKANIPLVDLNDYPGIPFP
jgi:lysophospholipase L1-like esterase